MGRLKIFATVALLGFFAGLLAQVASETLIPWLAQVLPLIEAKWFISGFAGAALTLVMVTVWAYMTDNKNKY